MAIMNDETRKPLTIKRRGGKNVECKSCGFAGLEWVQTDVGWRYVPYGTSDFSGAIHPLLPNHGEMRQTRKSETTTTKETTKSDETKSTVDLTAVWTRLDELATNVDKVKADKAEVAPLVETVKGLASAIEALESARHYEIKIGDLPTKDVGRQHSTFPVLATMVAAGVNVFLRGEAGSGKSSALHPLAELLGVPAYALSVGLQTTKSDLLGFVDANGNYQESFIYKAYKYGGICLIDEIDAGHAGVMTIINALTANNHAGFPNGEMVERNAKCYFIAAGNTFGRGADAQYIGRNQLDAATLNRFAYLEWLTDWAFVAEICGNPAWSKRVKAIHDAAETLGLRVIVGARAAINGARLLAAGMAQADVENAVIWSHMSAADADKLRKSV